MKSFEEIGELVREVNCLLIDKFREETPGHPVGTGILLRAAHVNAISRLNDAVVELELAGYYWAEKEKKNVSKED